MWDKSWKFINQSDMIHHKISNPDNKESKTKTSNGEMKRSSKGEKKENTQLTEQSLRTWSRDALESSIRDYLETTKSLESIELSVPPSSKTINNVLIKVNSDTVREYKKYMQAPMALRESMIQWRKKRILNLLEDITKDEEIRNKLKLEIDFLNSLNFYWTLKEKTLTPLLNMQVSFLNLRHKFQIQEWIIIYLIEDSLEKKELIVI